MSTSELVATAANVPTPHYRDVVREAIETTLGTAFLGDPSFKVREDVAKVCSNNRLHDFLRAFGFRAARKHQCFIDELGVYDDVCFTSSSPEDSKHYEQFSVSVEHFPDEFVNFVFFLGVWLPRHRSKQKAIVTRRLNQLSK
jgi:hypothetical protein